MAIQKKQQNSEKDASAGAAGAGDSKEAGRPIIVHSYSGFKKDERPRSFEFEGKKLTVLQVKKTWQEESLTGKRRKNFFRVHAHDGRTYDIALDQGTGEWTLEPRQGRA